MSYTYSLGSSILSPRSSLRTTTLSVDADADDWRRIQKNVFTRWCNERLKSVKVNVVDIATDFQDGTKLIALVQVLSHKQISRYNKKPKTQAQKIENVQIVLDFLKETEKMRNTNIRKLEHVVC